MAPASSASGKGVITDQEEQQDQQTTGQTPSFITRHWQPDELSISVNSNQVILVPDLTQSLDHQLEVTTRHQNARLPRRLTDDIIIISSNAGVIMGRIPNDLSNAGVVKWLDAFIDHISNSKEAEWWHTTHWGPWACYVFVPMNKTRSKWIYADTENDRLRPLTILGMLDEYAEEKKSWELRLPGQERPECRVAEIRGKCYVPTANPPRQKKRRLDLKMQLMLEQQDQQDQQDQRQEEPQERWRSTEIRFVWDPRAHVREVRLRDENFRDELVLEKVDMSLI